MGSASTTTAWLLPTMRGYRRRWLRPDLVAGVVAGTVVIPQAMGYATIAGLPVQVGLYSCMVGMVAYALLGGSHTASVSTTSTIAVLVAATLAGLGPRDPDALLRSAATLTFLVGLCLVLMRVLRLGVLVENLSPATLAGLKVGVGLTVAAAQLPVLLGVAAPPSGSGFFASLAATTTRLPQSSGVTVAVSVVALTALVVLRRVAPRIPGPLLVVAGGIVLAATTGLADRGLALVGTVPTGLPTLTLPRPDELFALLPGAAAIALMAFLETVVVARTNRRADEPRIEGNQELLAVAVAALAGGLAQSLPPAAGFSQSVVNLRSGARTQLAQLVTAGLAVAAALVLAPLLADLPKAVLAALVLVAVSDLVRPTELLRLARIDRVELWVALAVTALSLTGGMLMGVAVGVALTLLLVLRHVNQPRVRPLYRRAGGGWTTNPPTSESGTEVVPAGVVVLHLDLAVYTGNALATQDAVLAASRPGGEVAQTLVLEGSAVHRVTVPLVDMLRSLSDELSAQGTTFVLAEWPDGTLGRLRQTRWWADATQRGLIRDADASIDAALDGPVSGGHDGPDDE